jgi:hypothetical protein
MERKASESDSETRTREGRGDAERTTSAQSDAAPAQVPTLHRPVGNQAVQALQDRGELQAKLSVSQPSDPSEREAERVAEAVLSQEDQATESRQNTHFAPT